MPVLSMKKRSQRGANHAWRAFLACRLGLELFARPHNETVIRIPSPDEFDSTLEESFAKKFGPKRKGWQLIRGGEILHEHQKTFVPDFTFRHEDGVQVHLEIVGFWTPEYPAHRRESLQQFRHHNILFAVPKKSLREGATVGKNVLAYKTALRLTPLMEALERIRAESATTARSNL